MKVTVRSLWAPKAGNSRQQYEDAFWPSWHNREAQARLFRFAVADGATEAAFSRLWALLLVLLYCGSNRLLPEAVEERAKLWSRAVFARPLPWFAVEKAQRGSFSSLLGLTLQDLPADTASHGSWTAFAVGDSCLFQLRGAELVKSWPIANSEHFGLHPLLISTNPTKNERIWSALNDCNLTGSWCSGDQFLLMTDALAVWYLSSIEAGAEVDCILPDSSCTDTQFADWLAELRLHGEIRNDDVTLVRILIQSYP
jgi:hypothetical protein